MSSLAIGGTMIRVLGSLAICTLWTLQGYGETEGRDIDAFLQSHCVECHQGSDAEGDLDLSQLGWQRDQRDDIQVWMRIYDRISMREMPPSPNALTDDQRESLLVALADSLHDRDAADVRANGRGPMRRLTRNEYEHNLRDLLRLPNLDVRDILPEDRVAHHTNKMATALDMTRVQLNAYLDAADVALRQSLAPGLTPPVGQTYHAWAVNMFPKAVDHAGRESSFFAKDGKMVPLTNKELSRLAGSNSDDGDWEVAIFRSATWPYYGYPNGFVAERAGTYRVRFEARAVRQLTDFRLLPAPTSQAMTFRARKPTAADVSGDVRATGGYIDVQPEGGVYETEVQLRVGETIEYSLLGLPVPFPITSHGGPLYYDFPPMPEGGHPGIAYRWIEITGPVTSATWPPESHRVLFDDLPLVEPASPSPYPVEVRANDPADDAARLLRRFADAALHRRVPDSVLQPYHQLIVDQLNEGCGFVEAMLTGYKAILCSSHFLYLPEPRNKADHDVIASRLSHLLWDSRPDVALRELASQSLLRDPQMLRRQVDRLMHDERFDRFIRNLTDHWLDLRHLTRDDPDIRLYPEYRGDEYLVESMGMETRAFVRELFRRNLSVAELIDSDFVMVNDRLAKHYQFSPVSGSTPRAVPVPAWSHRGGLLTQAAILKVTANGTTTSPVVRGAWVMDRILGQPPPPPPPNVPAVEPDIRGATTIREILQAHASDPVCASCHRQFDPVGMALESFDILGGWRDRYRSLERGDEITGIDRAGHQFSYRVAAEVDSRGQWKDGEAFEGIDDLKQILASQPRQIARNLVEHFITYATGVPPRFSERLEIDRILDECQQEGYRVRDLIEAVITSSVFLGHVEGNLKESNRRQEAGS